MLKRTARLLFGLAAVGLVLAVGASAGATALPGSSGNESYQAWFVQLETPPATKGGSKSALASERATFFKKAADQGLSVKQRHAFDQLWNGLSVDIPASQAGALAAIPGVQAVYPVVPVALPPVETGSSDPALKYAVTMTGADVARNELGLDGHGIKVAIMDSGLDYTLPEFGSCSSVGGSCRVAGGHDFVGDDYDANSSDSTYSPVPHPDDDPAPCNPVVADQRALQPGAGTSAAAHGTHVAGIVGADGRSDAENLVTGVAPGASLYAYRVFGCNGSTDADIMVAAMERAAADDVDVLNMSIGAALFNFANYPTAVAADNLVDDGVVVVASIGNSGDTGLWSASAPGVGNKVIGTASVDNIRTFLPYFLGPHGEHMGYNVATGSPEPPTTGVSAPLAETGNPSATGDGCGPFAPAPGNPSGKSVAGKIALIRRGSPAAGPTCSFYLKAFNAQQAGALGVIIYNNVPGRVNPTVAPPTAADPPINIPVVTITAADGATLSSAIAAGPSTITWTAESEYFDNIDTPGLISSFSSWGTASDLTLKPDIAAPGGNIRSTWPHQQHGGHWVISGTSMASPHVAGAVALYLESERLAGRNPSVASVRSVFQNSAVPFRGTTAATSALASPARQGAGLLNIVGAIQQRTSVTPGKLSLGEGSGGAKTLSVTNNGSTAKTYNLSFTPASSPIAAALSSGGVTSQPPYTFFALGNPGATVSFTVDAATATQVTLAPGQSKDVVANINAAGVPFDRTLYGGWIVLTNASSSSDTLRVPYLGFKGDYQAIRVIGDAGCAMPMLARFGSDTDKIQCSTPARTIDGLIGQPTGGTWEQPKKDPIIVLYHFDHQATNVTLTLLDAATGEPATQGNRSAILQSLELHSRNSAATSFFAFTWDGTQAVTNKDTTQRKATPGGVYRLRITLTKVKALNDSRTAGTESWTSPSISLRDG
jgi:minor extracellular serine protease Vpr